MRLLHISAWNDSGGGFTHRLLDGHPDLRAWPFELLMGRDGVDVDRFGDAWFRGRFRWARLHKSLAARDGAALFDLVSDVELKSVLADPSGAKHRNFPLTVDLDAWRRETSEVWAASGRFDQPSFVEAYIETLFRLMDGSSDGRRVLAHCPCAILDEVEILADVPDTQFVCVVRSPLSGFADMSLRHPNLDPFVYARKWSLINLASALSAGKRPEKTIVTTLRKLTTEREATMRTLCAFAGIAYDPVVLTPTWRGRPITERQMGPFGGVPSVSAERERHIADALPPETRAILTDGTAAVSAILQSLHIDP